MLAFGPFAPRQPRVIPGSGEPAVIDSPTDRSPRQLARMAGALYLINIVGGAFAIGFVRAMLFVPDPAATAHNIQAHELLYRPASRRTSWSPSPMSPWRSSSTTCSRW